MVDFEKPPFRPLFGAFCPHPAHKSSLRAEWATHFLAPGKPGWPPTSTWPLFSRPTPEPAGSGRAQTVPRWVLPDTDSRIGEDRTGPDLDERRPYFSMSQKQAIRSDKSIRSPTRRRPMLNGRLRGGT